MKVIGFVVAVISALVFTFFVKVVAELGEASVITYNVQNTNILFLISLVQTLVVAVVVWFAIIYIKRI